jgi:hypothetical protein
MKTLILILTIALGACAVQPPTNDDADAATSTSSSNEQDCDPFFGCTGGGGGDAHTCDSLCRSDSECQVTNCFGSTCRGAGTGRVGVCMY